MSQNELTAAIRQIKELENLADEAKAEAEALKDRVKTYMGDTEVLHAGEYKVTWKAVTSSRFDSKAACAAMPELAERFMKTTTTRRFVIA